MNEFLVGLSSGEAWLWGLFVLGVMGGAAALLSGFWGAVFRVAGLLRGRQRGRG